MYIRTTSHRARQRCKALLGSPLKYYFSLHRAGYFLEVSEEEYLRIKHLPGVTRARAHYDDLHRCW